MTPAEQLREKVADLEQKLLTSHPLIPVLLRTIHNQLKEDPEIVTLMTEEEIGIIVSGLKKQTGVEIATTTLKTKTGTKSLKKLDVNDI